MDDGVPARLFDQLIHIPREVHQQDGHHVDDALLHHRNGCAHSRKDVEQGYQDA